MSYDFFLIVVGKELFCLTKKVVEDLSLKMSLTAH